MSTKSELLCLLEATRGRVVSGQDAAEQLGVSRAAVWKAAEALRKQGHRVEAVAGNGYMLAAESDRLSAEGIAPLLLHPGCPVHVLGQTTSTNQDAKRLAMEGAPHGTMVLAERQTAGRGRLGRSFESPPGGLYLSIVLRPRPQHLAAGAPFAAGLVTSAAGVAACRAVQQICGIRLAIKWVNDLYHGDKKCCGILTEATTSMENGSIEFMVAGIGINYTTPAAAFTASGQHVATSLYPEGGAPAPRNTLAAAIHTHFLDIFDALPDRSFLADYRALSNVLNKRVTVHDSTPYTARAIAIDEDAQLVVQKQDLTTATLKYGEISIVLPTHSED